MGQVQPRKPQMGLTFEDVWAMFQEDREQQTEWKKQQAEQQAEWKKKHDREMEKLRKIQEETWRQIKETDRIVGNLSNRFGELAEHMVAPSIMRKFNERGFHFDQIGTDVKFIDPENPYSNNTEVDVFLENGDIAIAVEVKSKPKIKDVDYHLWRMGILRRYADRKHDTRRFQGAVAGAIMGEDVRRYILESGFYVIEQTGDTVQITNPKDFKARDW